MANNIRSKIGSIRKFSKEVAIQRNEQIRFVNWWEESRENNWFYRFLLGRKIVIDRKLTFYSVFGPKIFITIDRSAVKIFYTGEDLSQENGPRSAYRDHLLDTNINLSLGFDFIDHPRYVRFPLWILFMFDPISSNKQIYDTCRRLSHSNLEKSKFAAMVSSWCPTGLRRDIYNSLSDIGRVDSDGKLLRNNNDLEIRFGNNKREYLRQYRFNICPENANGKGYVTEKIFQAIESSCIPIYAGAYNCPEPDVLNQEAIIFWNVNEDNSNVIRQIRELNSSERSYRAFASQPRLTPHAGDYIIYCLEMLERNLRTILC